MEAGSVDVRRMGDSRCSIIVLFCRYAFTLSMFYIYHCLIVAVEKTTPLSVKQPLLSRLAPRILADGPMYTSSCVRYHCFSSPTSSETGWTDNEDGIGSDKTL